MAKQQRIKETVQEIPAEVQDALDRWLKAKRQSAKLRATTNEWKEALIGLMKEHGLEELEVDDGDKVVKLEEDCKLHVETLKKDKGADDSEEEEEDDE